MNKVELLRNVFGEYFYRYFIGFFEKIFAAEYDSIFFLTRKGYLLYRQFEDVVGVSKNKCLIMTETAIPICRFSFEGKRVLIVDDTLLHGRTLLEVKTYLMKLGANVDTAVFIKNKSAYNKLSAQNSEVQGFAQLSEIYDNTYSVFELDEFDWISLSAKIVKSFRATNCPYISFLPVFSLTKEQTDIIAEKSEKIYEDRCICAKILFNPARFSEYAAYGECLRIYESSSTTVLVPIVFVNDSLINCKQCIKQIYLSVFGQENFTEVCELFQTGNDDRDSMLCESEARLIYYLLALLQLGSFLKTLNVEFSSIEFDKLGMELNFGSWLSSTLERRLSSNSVDYDDAIKAINDCAANSELCDYQPIGAENTYINELMCEYNELYCNQSGSYGAEPFEQLKALMDVMYVKAGELDDMSVYTSNERLKALTFKRHMEMFAHFDKRDFFKSYVLQMDIGNATLTLGKKSDKLYSFSRTGELATACHTAAFIPMLYVYDKFAMVFEEDNHTLNKLKNLFESLVKSLYKHENIPYNELYARKFLGNSAVSNILTDEDMFEDFGDDKISEKVLCIGCAIQDYVCAGNSVDDVSKFQEYCNAIDDFKWICDARL